jgi:hypothetical protein
MEFKSFSELVKYALKIMQFCCILFECMDLEMNEEYGNKPRGRVCPVCWCVCCSDHA